MGGRGVSGMGDFDIVPRSGKKKKDIILEKGYTRGFLFFFLPLPFFYNSLKNNKKKASVKLKCNGVQSKCNTVNSNKNKKKGKKKLKTASS